MINKVMLIGNLGADPELRYTPAGNSVCTLSVATSRRWKDANGNQQDETEWHRVIVWGKAADFCGEYLKKGNRVYVEGRITTRKWTDKDGNDRYTTEIVAGQLQSLTPRSDNGGGGGGEGPPAPDDSNYSGTGTGDDVPF